MIKDRAGRSAAVPLSSRHPRWAGRDFSKPNTVRNYTDLAFGKIGGTCLKSLQKHTQADKDIINQRLKEKPKVILNSRSLLTDV